MPTYPFFQHAYVVTDLDAAVRRWSELFGAGPFALRWHHVAPRFAYRGTPAQADVSYAFGYLGDIQVQLIQQHDDTPSIYRDMYGPDEEGFHHVATLVHDFAAAAEHFLDHGFELAASCGGWRRRGVLRHPLGHRGFHRDPRRSAVHPRHVRAGGLRTRATRPMPIRSSIRRSVRRARWPDIPRQGRQQGWDDLGRLGRPLPQARARSEEGP